MAGRGLSSVKSQKASRGFMTVLASAALEWLLMSMLFINAFFSYLIMRFSRCYELPIPCLLCSRLDHVFGGERAGFYWDLFCGDHKSEISSLVLCSHHDKLVDVHGMCESCLFSFATTGKSNAETYRLLVGKLGAGPDADLDEDPLVGDCNFSSPGKKRCCCCNELWTSRSHTQALLQTKSTEFKAADLDNPLFREFRQNLGGLKMARKTRQWSAASSVQDDGIEDSLPHFGYTELKINSDSESEIQVSDSEDHTALTHETSDPQSNFKREQSPWMEPHITMSENDSNSEKPIKLDVSVPERSELMSWEEFETIETCDDPSDSLTRDIGHGLEELDWKQIDLKVGISPTEDLFIVSDVPDSSNADQFPADSSKNSSDIEGKTETVQPEADESSNFHKAENAPTAADTTGAKTGFDLNDGGSQDLCYLDIVDAYKPAVNSMGRQLSGLLLEQKAGRDTTKVGEDLKLLLSQLSAAQRLELPANDMPSPRLPVNLDELKKSDCPTSLGMQILQKRLSLERNDSRRSLERNESGVESLDFSTVGEIEGESDIDRLRRQVEHDKKVISSLCRELEEERNASAIATNQAMAMITRLQEEKAALQMDALHDLRMMEEEAEYGMEALQKASDLLAEKEKEIQDLEAELEFYRKECPDNVALNHTLDTIPDSTVSGMPTNDHNNQESIGEDKDDYSKNALEFEDERLYIAQCLGQLEKKLYQYSKNGAQSYLTSGGYFGKQEGELSESKRHKDVSRVKNEVEENAYVPRSRSHALVRRVQSFKNPKSSGPSFMVRTESDVAALGHEVSNLSDRLQTLEADKSFIQHAISSLRNGDDGLHLIQEIACNLRELRRAGITRKQILT